MTLILMFDNREPAITAKDIRWGFDGAPEMSHTDAALAQAAIDAVANYHAEQLAKRVRAGQRKVIRFPK